MRSITIGVILLILWAEGHGQAGFLRDQQKFPRVREAIREKQATLLGLLNQQRIDIRRLHIIIVAYKHEEKLEVYAKNKEQATYRLLTTYEICDMSGKPGPKRKQGDRQVPEGFYSVTDFNPYSNFHLSLKIDYPNQSDQRLTTAINPGGDIFLHGACVTIGCIPITDDKIKELYLLAAYALEAGQKKIPVYIFPYRMTDEQHEKFTKKYANDLAILPFWKNLKQGYDRFFGKFRELRIQVGKDGKYLFTE